MKRIAILLSFIFSVTIIHAQLITGAETAVANTLSGKVRGYIHNTIFTYKGLPYAESKRFEAPHAPKAWTGVRSSMTYGPVAPLLTPTTSVQDEMEFFFHHDFGYTAEDCQRLNIWTPGINDGKKRPVLFWIHGGGFTAGSSQELPSYDGENLSKKGDVVVVSINHRLNILGFLDLSAYGEKYKHSANASILDIVFALQWVKNNIASFGGDPDNVTVFGQSGGGAKVNCLMAMPQAQGLFHKAINQSGAFRMDLKDKSFTQEIAAELLQVLNLQPDQVDSLQKIPFPQLSEAGAKALKIVNERAAKAGKGQAGLAADWGPSIDGTDIPYQLFSPEAFQLSKNIPLLIGTVKNEFVQSAFMNLTHAPAETVKMFLRGRYKDRTDEYIAAVQKVYPADTAASDWLDVDLLFRPGAVYQANQKSALHAAPVYMYLFTWQSPVLDGKYKAFHCMELPFVFDNIARCTEMTGGGKDAYKLSDKMSEAWIRFARTGNPNHKGLPAWAPFTAEKSSTMYFDNHCVVKPAADEELFKKFVNY